MSKRAAAFTKTDIRRALEAVREAGLPVKEVRVDAEGFTVLTSNVAERSRVDDDIEALNKALGIQGRGKRKDTLLQS